MRDDDEFDDSDLGEDGAWTPGQKRGKFKNAPDGRVYEHSRCGGQTKVSGGDFSHICDPFWPCTGTYCCTCAGFANLSEVFWSDTGECVADYRSRVRSETPGLVKVWRYGLGLLVGGAVGGGIGFLVAIVGQTPLDKRPVFALTGGLIGAVVLYCLGTFILNRSFDIDYRRMR